MGENHQFEQADTEHISETHESHKLRPALLLKDDFIIRAQEGSLSMLIFESTPGGPSVSTTKAGPNYSGSSHLIQSWRE